jgi:hypothetical protein
LSEEKDDDGAVERACRCSGRYANGRPSRLGRKAGHLIDRSERISMVYWIILYITGVVSCSSKDQHDYVAKKAWPTTVLLYTYVRLEEEQQQPRNIHSRTYTYVQWHTKYPNVESSVHIIVTVHRRCAVISLCVGVRE